MFEYTRDNHFRFGYYNAFASAAEWFACPLGREDKQWMVEFGACTRKPGSFREECYRAAMEITDSTDETPNIMFSGGCESEIVVRAFRDQCLPFKVSILQFTGNLNLHDIAFAVTFCEQNEIPYDIYRLNVKDFLDFEVYQYANRTQSVSPQFCTTMWLADQIDGLPILGSGEPYVRKSLPFDYVPGESPYEPSPWFFEEKEKVQAWYRHFMNQERPAIPGFFQYTPELMYAFLNHPVVHELVTDQKIGKLSTVTSKSRIYYHEFPDMTPRPKFTGFEKIPEWDETVREVLLDEYGAYNRAAQFEYKRLMQNFVKPLSR